MLPWEPRTQRARKQYWCDICPDPINVGDMYVRQWVPNGIVPEGFQGGTFRLHLKCAIEVDEASDDTTWPSQRNRFN